MNVQPDRSASAYAKEQIYIAAPAEKIFRIIHDIADWPRWQKDVKKASVDGVPEEGTSFEWTAGGLRIRSKIHTLRPYNAIGWTGKIWWITAVHNWRLDEQGSGTLVTVEESLEGLGSSLFGRSLASGMKKNLLELKEEAER